MTQVATTPPTAPVEGSKISKGIPKSPVFITRLRVVGLPSKETIEMQLEQMFAAPVSNQGGILGLFMAGHSGFNTNDRKRVMWQNISTVQAVKWGIIKSWEEVGEAKIEVPDAAPVMGAKLCNIELRIPNPSGDGTFLPHRLVEVDTFTPRKWVNSQGQPMEQQPKRAGQDGDILLYNGKKIYRNVGLALPGTDDVAAGRKWDEDLVIVHNNQIQGSTVKAAMAAANIKQPGVPGEPHNAGIGDTPNLHHGEPEGATRHAPEEVQQS